MEYYTCKMCNLEVDVRLLSEHSEECMATKLSEKEIKLLNYIETNKTPATVEAIQTDLGEAYLGAIGKLVRYELIERKKEFLDKSSLLNPYGRKWTKYYVIKEEKA